MKMKNILLGTVLLSAVAFVACNKENQTSTLKLRLTDAPVAADEVNIDLTGVQVKFDKDTSKWVTMEAKTGIYNLLGLQNGVDTLIAQGDYPTGVVKEIRLVVGANNTIVINGQSSPLTIPSGAESGLKIKVNKKLQATIETVVIDFDAALSIKQENDGYKLRPVVKVK
jgi:hypothetical protein